MFKGSNHKRSADTFYGDLYHVDVYMPKELKKIAKRLFANFRNRSKFNCQHVYSNKDCDKCHSYNVELIQEALLKVNLDDVNIFEIGTSHSITKYPNTHIIKFGVRFPYNDEEDIIIIYNPNGSVRTAWLNYKEDNHKTLDVTKYIQPPWKRENDK